MTDSVVILITIIIIILVIVCGTLIYFLSHKKNVSRGGVFGGAPPTSRSEISEEREKYLKNIVKRNKDRIDQASRNNTIVQVAADILEENRNGLKGNEVGYLVNAIHNLHAVRDEDESSEITPTRSRVIPGDTVWGNVASTATSLFTGFMNGLRSVVSPQTNEEDAMYPDHVIRDDEDIHAQTDDEAPTGPPQNRRPANPQHIISWVNPPDPNAVPPTVPAIAPPPPPPPRQPEPPANIHEVNFVDPTDDFDAPNDGESNTQTDALIDTEADENAQQEAREMQLINLEEPENVPAPVRENLGDLEDLANHAAPVAQARATRALARPRPQQPLAPRQRLAPVAPAAAPAAALVPQHNIGHPPPIMHRQYRQPAAPRFGPPRPPAAVVPAPAPAPAQAAPVRISSEYGIMPKPHPIHPPAILLSAEKLNAASIENQLKNAKSDLTRIPIALRNTTRYKMTERDATKTSLLRIVATSPTVHVMGHYPSSNLKIGAIGHRPKQGKNNAADILDIPFHSTARKGSA